MSLHIMKCPVCKRYSLRSICDCGEKTIIVKPPRYSTQDKYSSYRREVKRMESKRKGLL